MGQRAETQNVGFSQLFGDLYGHSNIHPGLTSPFG